MALAVGGSSPLAHPKIGRFQMGYANRLTILRIILIPPFIITILNHRSGSDGLRFMALGIFSLAVFTDFLDGFIARVRKERTELGSYLDPIADKLLLATAFILLTISKSLPSSIPLWVPTAVIAHILILFFGTIILVRSGSLKMRPTLLGKCTTSFQMATVIATLLGLPFNLLMVIWIITVSITALSIFDYTFKATKILSERKA